MCLPLSVFLPIRDAVVYKNTGPLWSSWKKLSNTTTHKEATAYRIEPLIYIYDSFIIISMVLLTISVSDVLP